MTTPENTLSRAAFYLACGSAISILFSIAISHTLLVAALVALLASGQRPRVPPIWLPVLVFMALTVVSMLASPEPMAGLPQIKKFFVYLAPIVMYTAVRHLADVRRLILAWAIVSAASATWGLVQFWQKREEAKALGQNFYLHYIADRMTGFMSHWMTFGGEQMMALTMLIALLVFGVSLNGKARIAFVSCSALIAASIVLGLTRSVWIATAASMFYLLGRWRPKLLLASPLILALVLVAAPRSVQERALSIVRPSNVDSNEFRRLTLATGIEMVKANPLVGVGPQRVGREFKNYLPPGVQTLPAGYYDHLHNTYLHYAAERGIPAMLGIVWLLGRALWDFWRAAQQTGPGENLRRAVLYGAFGCVVAIVIEGFFEVNLGDTEVLTMFLIVVAWGYTAVNTREDAALA